MPMPGITPRRGRGGPRLAPPRVIRDEARVLLAAELDAMSVCCAHLTFVQGPNVRQLRAATALLRELPGPRLLLGDLNMAAPLPRLVTSWHPLARGRTFPSWQPRLQIDHVLADRAMPVTASRIEALAFSDHCAVVVDLG
jgi:endonuclease/exonuclease/phosphatase family metal-dependent hydrolase